MDLMVTTKQWSLFRVCFVTKFPSRNKSCQNWEVVNIHASHMYRFHCMLLHLVYGIYLVVV